MIDPLKAIHGVTTGIGSVRHLVGSAPPAIPSGDLSPERAEAHNAMADASLSQAAATGDQIGWVGGSALAIIAGPIVGISAPAILIGVGLVSLGRWLTK